MEVMRVSSENLNELKSRKIDNESPNSVLTRILRESKIFIIDGKMVEVMTDGPRITIKSGGSYIPEKTVQD